MFSDNFHMPISTDNPKNSSQFGKSMGAAKQNNMHFMLKHSYTFCQRVCPRNHHYTNHFQTSDWQFFNLSTRGNALGENFSIRVVVVVNKTRSSLWQRRERGRRVQMGFLYHRSNVTYKH